MEPQTQEQVLNQEIQSPKSKKKIWVIVGILVILLLAGGGYYYYKINNQSMDSNNKKENDLIIPSTEGNISVVDSSISNENQEYILGIHGMNVKIDILVNKIVVFSDKLYASVSIPTTRITNYMKNGENEVEVTVTVIPNEYNNYSCKITFGYINVNESETIIYDKEKLIECGEELENKGFEHFIRTISAKNLVSESVAKTVTPEEWVDYTLSDKEKLILVSVFRAFLNEVQSGDIDRIKKAFLSMTTENEKGRQEILRYSNEDLIYLAEEFIFTDNDENYFKELSNEYFLQKGEKINSIRTKNNSISIWLSVQNQDFEGDYNFIFKKDIKDNYYLSAFKSEL